MASVNKTKGSILAGAGLGLLALLLWSYCGRVDGGQAPVVTKAPPLIESEPVFEEPVIPVVAPVAVLADEPRPIGHENLTVDTVAVHVVHEQGAAVFRRP